MHVVLCWVRGGGGWDGLCMWANVGDRFVKVLVIEIFSSVLGLFGLIIGLLLSGTANAFSSTTS